MFSFSSMISTALQRRLQRRQDVAHQIMGQRPGRLDALLLVGDRGGLHRADPDRQVAVAVDLPEQHDRLVAGQLHPNPDHAQLAHRRLRVVVHRAAPFRHASRTATPLPCTVHAPRAGRGCPREPRTHPGACRRPNAGELIRRGLRSPARTSAACSCCGQRRQLPCRLRGAGPGRRVALPRQRRDQLREQADLPVGGGTDAAQVPRLAARTRPARRPPAAIDHARPRRTGPAARAVISPSCSSSASVLLGEPGALRSAPPGASRMSATRPAPRVGAARHRTVGPDRAPAPAAAGGRLAAVDRAPAAHGSPAAAGTGRAGRPARTAAASTSGQLYLRYPAAVRCGSTSPSASRNRSLEMVMSGNSAAQLRQHLADAHQRSRTARDRGALRVAAAGCRPPPGRARPRPPAAGRR